MAAANEVLKLAVTEKIPLTKGRAIYLGTATGGSEYKTGGVEIVEETESRYKVPARIDMLTTAGLGLISAFVKPNLVKFFAEQTVGTSTETGLAEYKSGASLATAINAVPFFAIGTA